MRTSIAIGLTLLVAACTQTTTSQPDELSQLQPGKTTYSEAVAALGTPVGTSVDFDNTRAATFVYRLPPAPAQAPGTVPAENLADVSPAAGNTNGSTVIVRCSFDDAEVLIGCRSQQVPQPTP
ncbi:MAG TPA: hypothetical protein VMU85_18450 [Stellaceae bacterium]|nr:hypothetical protein [Stellaceae bacterium]